MSFLLTRKNAMRPGFPTCWGGGQGGDDLTGLKSLLWRELEHTQQVLPRNKLKGFDKCWGNSIWKSGAYRVRLINRFIKFRHLQLCPSVGGFSAIFSFRTRYPSFLSKFRQLTCTYFSMKDSVVAEDLKHTYFGNSHRWRLVTVKED